MGKIYSIGWNRGQNQQNSKYGISNFSSTNFSFKILLTGFGLTQNGLDVNGVYHYWNDGYPGFYGLLAVNGSAWGNPKVTNFGSGPLGVFYIRQSSAGGGMYRWTINEQNLSDGTISRSTWYSTNTSSLDSPISLSWQINYSTGPGTPSSRGAIGGTPGSIIKIDPTITSNVGDGNLKLF